MAVRHGLFVANGSSGVTAPQDARLALTGLLNGAGVLSGMAVSGSSSGPNMKYTVAAGQVVTSRSTVASDGLYVWSNDGAVTIDSGAPAPSSGTRYDVVYALHQNANDGIGDANSDPIISVAVGSASATPAVPTAPTGAVVLATALVGTNIANAAAVSITQTTAFTGTRRAPAGQWQNLLLPHSGWAVPTGSDSGGNAYVAQVRLNGDHLELQGYLQHSTFNNTSPAAAWRLPTTVPFPSRDRTVGIAGANGAVRTALFRADGTGDIYCTATAASSAYWCLDDIWLPAS